MGTSRRQMSTRTVAVTALCLALTSLALSVCANNSNASNITVMYDSITHRLHLSCQYSDNNFLYMNLLRDDTGTTLANLTKGDKGLALHERVTVNDATQSTHILEAVLSHVTCFDLGNYSCQILADPPKKRVFFLTETKLFSNAGVMRALNVQPLQSRYAVGTTLHLTCTAEVWLSDHPIVWETRLPGEQYQPVVAMESDLSNPTENADKLLCGGSTTSSLNHTLKIGDDNREWRCRLQNTSDGHHQASYIVAVQMDSGRCIPSTTPEETSSANTRMQNPLVSEWSPHDAVIETNINKNFSASEERGDNSHIIMLTLAAVTAILFASMVISLVAMATIVKKRPALDSICRTPSSHCNEYTSPFPASILPPSPAPTHHYLQPHEQESLESGDGEAEETALKDPPPDLMTCSPSSSVYITNLTTLLQPHQHSSLPHCHCQDPASCPGHCLYYNEELPDNQRNNIINQHPSTIVTRSSCSQNNSSCVCCNHISKPSNATYAYKCSNCSPVTMERLK